MVIQTWEPTGYKGNGPTACPPVLQLALFPELYIRALWHQSMHYLIHWLKKKNS